MITQNMKEKFCYLRDKMIENHYKHLNHKQREAVLFGNGPALVLACPGSGKTTILIHRVHYLITFGPVYKTKFIPHGLSMEDLHLMERFINNPKTSLNPHMKTLLTCHRINPQNILSLTFSNASARDMKDRFYQRFDNMVGTNVEFSTIHRFALGVIRRYASINKIQYTILEGEKSPIHKAALLKQIYHQVNKDFINEDKLEELSNAIGFVKNAMVKPCDFSKCSIDIDQFENIYTLYEKYKKDHCLIDFDDMLSLAYKILKNHPNLLNKYRHQYPYIQVDEAQDTSKLQHALIYLLVTGKNNIFMVADDDQSIYGFRGAFPEALLKYDNTYKGSITFFMEQNYRSSEDIVSVSNVFIQTNKERYPKGLFTENGPNKPIDLITIHDEDAQTKHILQILKRSKDLSGTAILFRNNISAIPLVEEFERNNIPFYMRGFNMSFFKHWVVQDILSFFDVALNPYDRESFERIYYKMNGYIPKAAITHMDKNHNAQSVFKHLMCYPGFKNYQVKNIHRLASDFEILSKKKPKEAIVFIENDLDYKKYLKSHCQKLKYSYENIGLILSHLKVIASNTNSIIEFMKRLNELQNIMEASKFNKNKNAVVFSTVHSAKGLEFDHVYMIDLMDGQFPTKNSIDLFEEGDLSSLEEERRLFYVAMTRAKNSLSLLNIDFKDGAKVKPSRFVTEVIQCMKVCYPEAYDFKTPPKKVHAAPRYFKSSDSSITHNFSIGTTVIHKKFGAGVIRSIDKDIIQIDFDLVGLRSLSLGVCMDQKILNVL